MLAIIPVTIATKTKSGPALTAKAALQSSPVQVHRSIVESAGGFCGRNVGLKRRGSTALIICQMTPWSDPSGFEHPLLPATLRRTHSRTIREMESFTFISIDTQASSAESHGARNESLRLPVSQPAPKLNPGGSRSGVTPLKLKHW